MIISNEQALLAAQDLKILHRDGSIQRPSVSSAVFEAARAVVDGTPETREDRVSEARIHLGSGLFDSHQVAEKMISRIISDSLR